MSKLKYAPQIIAKQWRHLKKPRRTGLRVFGVGAAKTGTHTLAQMFEDHVRTGHEADADALIRRFLHKAETGDAAPLHKLLRWRERLRVHLGARNLLGVEERTHPLGAALDLRLFARATVRVSGG